MKKNIFLFRKSLICLLIIKRGYLISSITITSLLFSVGIKAQIYTGTGGNITNDGQETYFNLLVTGLVPAQLDSAFGVEQVCININHPVNRELTISLKSPDGRVVKLLQGSSLSGTNFTNTCLDSRADSSITLTNGPYNGTYKPIGFIGRFNNGQTGNGLWKLIVKDFQDNANAGSLLSWSISFGNSPSKPVIFTSSNLPIVFINTGNQSISDSEILANMGIIDNGAGQRNDTIDNRNNYNGKTMIHIRGNTSKNFDKKSYALETHDISGNDLNVSLLGMPAESDWVLTASYTDKTLIRNPIAYDLFREMGHYSPRYKNVELVINNEYKGVYEFMEKPKRNNSRVDISKLQPDENLYPDITGGYIIKIDRPDEDGWYSLIGGNSQNNSSFYYQYVYPKDVDITVPQKNYIQYFMDTVETVINSASYADPANGYRKYLDVESFIDFFIINELSKNVDAYRLSTFLYKDNISYGGKLHIGPVWDYDIAWHNADYGNAFSPAGWEYQTAVNDYPSPAWWGRFLQDSYFLNKLACRWQELRQGILENTYLNNYIDAGANLLNEAQQRNFTQWPTMGAYISPNPQNQYNADYMGEVLDLKNWITARTAWMDANITGLCTVGIQDIELAENSVQPFPNPFTNDLNIVYKVPENIAAGMQAKVKIELINVLGDIIQLIFNGNKNSGTYQENIAMPQLASGVYFIKMSVNSIVFYQKVVKMK